MPTASSLNRCHQLSRRCPTGGRRVGVGGRGGGGGAGLWGCSGGGGLRAGACATSTTISTLMLAAQSCAPVETQIAASPSLCSCFYRQGAIRRCLEEEAEEDEASLASSSGAPSTSATPPAPPSTPSSTSLPQLPLQRRDPAGAGAGVGQQGGEPAFGSVLTPPEVVADDFTRSLRQDPALAEQMDQVGAVGKCC